MAGNARELQTQEKRAGLLLIAAAAVALILANSGLAHAFHDVLEAKIGPPMPRFGVMSVHQWVADGLMAVFFLLVGLEVKREWYDGRLATPAERRLPIIAASAGMVVPAIVYLAVTGFDPALVRGWAIPSATDIAFAVGVLALLGSRANPSVKLLLVTIAIVDDVGAVLIIALVYTADLNAMAIGFAALLLGFMAALNLFGVRRLWPYLLGFAFLWYCMLASGIHATIAGVLAALTVPLGRGEPHSPLKRLEHDIHPWVMFGVMPLFGLVSAGVHVGSIGELARPLPLAILAGLFVGKQLGVFGALWLTVKAGFAPRPEHTQLERALRGVDPVRDRLHDEPVHQCAGVSALARSRRGCEAWNAGRVAFVGPAGLCCASNHIARLGRCGRSRGRLRDLRRGPYR